MDRKVPCVSKVMEHRSSMELCRYRSSMEHRSSMELCRYRSCKEHHSSMELCRYRSSMELCRYRSSMEHRSQRDRCRDTLPEGGRRRRSHIRMGDGGGGLYLNTSLGISQSLIT